MLAAAVVEVFAAFAEGAVDIAAGELQDHVQHHVAQLSLALRKSAGIGIDWVATG